MTQKLYGTQLDHGYSMSHDHNSDLRVDSERILKIASDDVELQRTWRQRRAVRVPRCDGAHLLVKKWVLVDSATGRHGIRGLYGGQRMHGASRTAQPQPRHNKPHR